MAFRFSLDPLLRMWQSRQRYERRKLEALGARLGALRAELRRTEESALTSRRETAARLKQGALAAELHYSATCEENRRTFLCWLQNQVKTVEDQHRAQMVAYRAAERQCKIVDSLRRRQFEAYQREELRREQKRLDEIFLLGRAQAERGRGEAPPGSS